jgi:hypothetical protein
MPATQVISMAHISRGHMVDQLLGLFGRWFLYSARMGTKACENAPSANRRRSRLGMRKAMLKASV